MSPSRERYYRVLYGVAAVYDLTLGLVFLFFNRKVFEWLDALDTLPEHGAFMSLIAAFLFVIGLAYVFIASGDLRRNVDLIAVGALYKLAYTGVAAYYLAVGDYPHIVFIAVFGVADLIFFALMTESWWFLRRTEPAAN
jgi:formate/nitrite transporter FocA (FNT family)